MDPGNPAPRFPGGGRTSDRCLLRRNLPLRLPPDRQQRGCPGSDTVHLYRRSALTARLSGSEGVLPHLAELPAEEDFSVRILDRVLLERIEAWVSGLEPREQAVFRLRIYGEKTFPEIAASLRESEAAVKSRYYRLIGRLRKEFGSDEI